VEDNRSGPLFSIYQSSLHSKNQLISGESNERRVIQPAFFALSYQDEVHYHYLDVRINSGDDGATSCKNLVNFCLITPDITGLICVPMYL